MALALDLGPDEVAIQDSLRRFCERRLGPGSLGRRSVSFSRNLWLELAELGIFDLARDGTVARHQQIAAALGVLGAMGFPGPLPQTMAAAMALDEARWAPIGAGLEIVSFGLAPIVPWADVADLVLVVEDGQVRQAAADFDFVATLGRTASARVTPGQDPSLGEAGHALAVFQLGVSAYVEGAGRALLEEVTDHARTRRQFGKTLGEFQAVAFPLAEARMDLDAALVLIRAAALAADQDQTVAGDLILAARIAATRAALASAYAAHQTYGAYGVTEQGPVAWLSRRIQEYATQSPSLGDAMAGLSADTATSLDPARWAS